MNAAWPDPASRENIQDIQDFKDIKSCQDIQDIEDVQVFQGIQYIQDVGGRAVWPDPAMTGKYPRYSRFY
jgi:hypothetical protein